MRLLVNPRARPAGALAAAAPYLGRDRLALARAEIETWDGYRPTPLADLPGLARRLDIGRLRIKDEGRRFHLKSFKALGGPYAISRIASRDGGRRDRVFASATDGNHGRAVAWGASRLGCRAVIYVPAGVSEGRIQAIASFGAEIVRTKGTYDEAVAECARTAVERGWTVIADTSEDAREEVPNLIMEGYLVAADEAAGQVGEAPTHIFVQAGVGGLACAVAALSEIRWGAARPRLVVVEPETAACLMLAAEHGSIAQFPGNLETVMGGLSCGLASAPAWRVLETATDAFLTVPDGGVPEAMRLLAAGADGDPPLVAGESGVAGLVGLMAAAGSDDMRRQLGLDPASRILLFSTEGDTDPEVYRRLVGRDAEAVRAA